MKQCIWKNLDLDTSTGRSYWAKKVPTLFSKINIKKYLPTFLRGIFLHHFFYPKFYYSNIFTFFYTKIFAFLHQIFFFYFTPKIFTSFTPIFYTNFFTPMFLHQFFDHFLHQFFISDILLFYTKFGIFGNSF